VVHFKMDEQPELPRVSMVLRLSHDGSVVV
jgi:hypothetical protein